MTIIITNTLITNHKSQITKCFHTSIVSMAVGIKTVAIIWSSYVCCWTEWSHVRLVDYFAWQRAGWFAHFLLFWHIYDGAEHPRKWDRSMSWISYQVWALDTSTEVQESLTTSIERNYLGYPRTVEVLETPMIELSIYRVYHLWSCAVRSTWADTL